MDRDDIRALTERVRVEVERVRPMISTGDFEFDQAFGPGSGQSRLPGPPPPPPPFGLGFGQGRSSSDNESGYYDRGQSALSQRQYDQAIAWFDRAIAVKGTRTDGALYWKAFAQYKLGRSSDATATLGELQKFSKESKYLPDAKALEAEVRKSAGQPARPESEDDEDLKLLAIQSLSSSDPGRAIPLLQGVLSSASSLKLKERALYVLALSNDPRAHEMLVTIGKGGNPDLQLKAIRYLGISRRRVAAGQATATGRTSTVDLAEIYNSTQSDEVKRAVIQAYGASGDLAALVSVASGAASALDLRREAINQLGSTRGSAELASIYQKEPNKELKMQILSALGSMGAYDRVIEVAKTEKDPDVRNRAIRSLGNMRSERSGRDLVEIYGTLSDVDAKKAVIAGLSAQDNADALITIVRKESNFELKKRIVESLSHMPRNKAAQDYLAEIIK
jgi:HEAT repeat protein